MELTKNFTLEELTKSEYGIRNNIKEQNKPSEEVKENLEKLCINVLQPLRDIIKSSIKVTCGYRCLRVNEGVGGARTSQHLEGKAADIEYYIGNEENNLLLAQAVLLNNIPFDQMILEFGTKKNPSWVHVSYNEGKNRGQILEANKINSKTIYSALTKQEVLHR